VRRLLRWLLWGLLALVLLVVLLLVWLLQTGGGRDFALSRLQGMLEPDQLQVGDADGVLGSGPLELRGVEYRLDDGSRVLIDRLRLDTRRRGLLGRRIEITDFAADGVTLQLVENDVEAGVDDAPWQLPESLPWPTVDTGFDIDVDTARINGLRITRGEELLVDARQVDLAATWPRNEPLTLESLQVHSERGELRASGWLGLAGRPAADLELQFQPPGSDAALEFDLRSLDDGAVRAALNVPGSGDVVLDLQSDLGWQLDIALDDFDAARWWPLESPPPVLDLVLQASGDRREAALQGVVGSPDRRLVIEPSTLRIEPEAQRLRLDPLQLALDDGSRLQLAGAVDFADGLQLDLAGDAAPLLLPLGESEPARYAGPVRLHGRPGELVIELDGRLQRGELAADLDLRGLLLDDRLQLERLDIVDGERRLSASGEVGWATEPHWQIDAELHRFDPGVLAAEFAGRLDGRLRSHGRLLPEGLELQVDVDDLRGSLGGSPLQAEGRILLRPDGNGEADFSARLGDGRVRVRGEPGDGRDLRIDIDDLQLAGLVPQAGGELSARLRLRGVGDAARVTGRIDGRGLRYVDDRAGTLDIDVDMPLDLAGSGHLRLRGSELRLRGEELDRIDVDVDGSLDGLNAEFELEGPRLSLAGDWSGRRVKDDWIGRFGALELQAGELEGLGPLVLDDPADIRVGPDGVEIGRQCLRAAQGSACFSISHGGGGQTIDADIDALPLALLEPWVSSEAMPTRLEGQLDGSVRVQLVDGAPRDGDIELRSAAGALIQRDEPGHRLVTWQGLRLIGRLQDGRLLIELDSTIDDAGELHVRLQGGNPFADGEQALSGRVDVDLPQLRLLALLPDTVVAPEGKLLAGFDVSGSWQQPAIAGELRITAFRAEVPALGIVLSDSSLRIRGDRQRLQVDGLAHSGEQPLRFDGVIEGLGGDAMQVRVDIDGDDVLLVDTPQVRAVASPDLQAEYVDGKLRLRGSIGVPTARLQLDQLDSTVAVSDDVVVLDPRPGREQDSPLPVDADIRVVLGDDVELEGLGFDGGLSGTLQVRERPGRPTTARGSLTVRGEYTAYGQDLTIDRGRLNFASTPIDDPALDVRVVREVRDTRVGLNIRGSARDPIVSVWSDGDRAIDEAEALSLLLFGRPLRSTGEGDSEQLTQAALAVGGNLLAARLGARLGFDTFEVANSESLGGTAFTVGKYLSPRLHISYGVALFGQGQVLSLTYMINERLEVQLEAGQENRASLNYRIER